MFVCALTLHVRLEKKTDFLHKLSDEIAPLLTRSPGALEFLVLQDDIELDRFLVLSLWQTREEVVRYCAAGLNPTKLILEPYLTFPTGVGTYRVEDIVPRYVGTSESRPRTKGDSGVPELKIVRRR